MSYAGRCGSAAETRDKCFATSAPLKGTTVTFEMMVAVGGRAVADRKRLCARAELMIGA